MSVCEKKCLLTEKRLGPHMDLLKKLRTGDIIVKIEAPDIVSHVIKIYSHNIHIGVVLREGEACSIYNVTGDESVDALRTIKFRLREDLKVATQISDYEVYFQGKWYALNDDMLRRYASIICSSNTVSSPRLQPISEFLAHCNTVNIYYFHTGEEDVPTLVQNMKSSIRWIEENTAPITCTDWLNLCLDRQTSVSDPFDPTSSKPKFSCNNVAVRVLCDMGLLEIKDPSWRWGNKAQCDVIDSDMVELYPHTVRRNIPVSDLLASSPASSLAAGGRKVHSRRTNLSDLRTFILDAEEARGGTRHVRLRRKYNEKVVLRHYRR